MIKTASAQAQEYNAAIDHVPFILRMAAVAVLVVILARPQSTNSWQNSSTEGIDIVPVSYTHLVEILRKQIVLGISV